MPAEPVLLLPASYFDGVEGRAREVTLQLADGRLLIRGESIERSVAWADVQWPERTRHGTRVAHLAGGGAVQSGDAAAWDAWSLQAGRRESLVVKMQQSWGWVLGSVAGLVVLAVALQQWGLPLASRAVVAVIPERVEQSLGDATLAAIDQYLMKPSKLPIAEQQRLRVAFMDAMRSLPAGTAPRWQLVFRQSRIGPNALALPGGTLVMTDELVELVDGDEKVVTAVLAHELGHVRHRHGLRMLVQTAVLGGLASVVLGDFSSVLAGVPVLLGQASYSREAEREADAEAVRILRAASISPAVMVTLFEKLDALRQREEAGEGGAGAGTGEDGKPGSPPTDHKGSAKRDVQTQQGESWLGIAFASHPSDADRIRYFRQAAGLP